MLVYKSDFWKSKFLERVRFRVIQPSPIRISRIIPFDTKQRNNNVHLLNNDQFSNTFLLAQYISSILPLNIDRWLYGNCGCVLTVINGSTES